MPVRRGKEGGREGGREGGGGGREVEGGTQVINSSTGNWGEPLYLQVIWGGGGGGGGSPCTYRWLKMLRMTPKSICPIPRMTAIFIL